MIAVLEQHRFGSSKRAVFCSLPSVVDTVEMRHPRAVVATRCDDPAQVVCDAILETATKESNDDLANSD